MDLEVIDLFNCVDPITVLLGEGVEDLSPGGDSGGDVLAGSSFFGDDEVGELHRGFLSGEAISPAGGLPESAVQRLDHFGGIDQLADLHFEW
ncbi:hypothetical protein [Micromonospora zamorensis]|uniref:hypothetical protein n=1 Tax=Micromonospora zamorensis TaxID=709883 RepID=UPI003F4CB67B